MKFRRLKTLGAALAMTAFVALTIWHFGWATLATNIGFPLLFLAIWGPLYGLVWLICKLTGRDFEASVSGETWMSAAISFVGVVGVLTVFFHLMRRGEAPWIDSLTFALWIVGGFMTMVFGVATIVWVWNRFRRPSE